MSWRIVARSGQRDRLGEGLLWSARDNAVYWTDIVGQALNRLTLGDGAVTRWSIPEMIGWIIERRDAPGFIAGMRSGIVALTLDPVVLTPLATPEPDLPGNRMNDAKADAQGRIWAGTMPLAGNSPSGHLYRFDSDHRLSRMDGGYSVANGPAISPAQDWLYHTDSPLGRIYRFPLHTDGSLGPRSLFIQFAPGWGAPDGMTCDDAGGLWVAHWGGARISRFTAEGKMDRSIVLPVQQVTNICFAGPGLDRMFVTSALDGQEKDALAGCLFEVDCEGARGLPPGQFWG